MLAVVHEVHRHSRSLAQNAPHSVTPKRSSGNRSNTPDQMRNHRPGRPPPGLGREDPDVGAVGGTVGDTRVDVDRQVQLLAHGPHRVVPGSWYGSWGCHIDGMRMPPRNPEAWARRISATAASTSNDRHDGDPRPPLGDVAAQLGEPAVVGPGTGEQQLAGRVAGGAQPGAERRGGAAADRVGVGEDHLADHAVGVELLVAAGGLPPAPQTLLVLLLPLLGELLVEEPRLRQLRRPGPLARKSSKVSRNSGSR